MNSAKASRLLSNRMLTPRQLSEAIGASESSVRRWVDSGDLRMTRTTGGHRRIPIQEAIRFIRQHESTVLRPDILGLDELALATEARTEKSKTERLADALMAGQRNLAMGLITSWYLDGERLSEIFDEPLRGALQQIGELWQHDSRGVLIEHRATGICIDLIARLRDLLPPVDESAPLAIGAGVANDPYILPSMMVAAILADLGFRDVNFGANTPLELLASEAIERHASLVWLSVTTHQDPKALRSEITQLANKLSSCRIQLVIGGQYHAQVAPRGLSLVTPVRTMTELAALARGMLSASATSERS